MTLDLLVPLTSRKDAQALRGGEFVEYTASFRPSEIATMMDVVTPNLVAAITSFLRKRREIDLFDGYETFEERRTAAFKMHEDANARAELAREITHAFQADFRQDETQEYYGVIGEGDSQVTAVTICDTVLS